MAIRELEVLDAQDGNYVRDLYIAIREAGSMTDGLEQAIRDGVMPI